MKNAILYLSLCFGLSIAMVTGLFMWSRHKTHHDNGFYRFFPPHPVTRVQATDLRYNSYYIIGTYENKVYLSNLTAPSHLLSVTIPEMDTVHIRLKISTEDNRPLRRNTRVSMWYPYFYIADGYTPQVLRGKFGEWHARPFMYDSAYFNTALPIGPKSLAIRTTSGATRELVLGKQTGRSPHVTLAPGLLEKQQDGIFCTDGILQYNKELSQLIYLYYYRNQYIVTDTLMRLLYRGKTIDTNSVAKVKTVFTASDKSRKMAVPPPVVNSHSTTRGHRLFVHSVLRAKNESEETFGKASVIDVYDLKERNYAFSFYLYAYDGFRVSDFVWHDNYLIALHHKHLVVYTTRFDAYASSRPGMLLPVLTVHPYYRDNSRNVSPNTCRKK